MKKKSIITIVIIVVVVLAVYLWFKSGFNNMVKKQEAVQAQWAQVENVYQRRADLIPNLVATVKGYAEHEQSTLTAVIEARSKATSVTIDPSNITPEQLAQFQEAQDQLSGALSRLLVSIERYPDLKANENFMALQSQLEGTENRITVERQKFNERAMEYNQYIRMFPRNIIAGMFDFEKVGYFKAQAGAETAPKVEF
ncbi:MAG: LemA family protein [Bacteroidales bacterium]|nr:LemA family protein [Bacteroidales bacterium]